MKRFSETLQRFATGQVAFPGIEIIYASHSSWPLPPAHEVDTEQDFPHSLAVSVLDSSFNPPTMAHFALSRIPPPAPSGPHDMGFTSPRGDFDAKLLLFSIKNADKALKPGDATHTQRLEMMIILARELERAQETFGDHQGLQNVAVAVCQEPTFVGKSAALRVFLNARLAAFSSRPGPAIQLSFLLGFDTLERLFAARYYGSDVAMKDALRKFLSSSGDNSRVICARRSTGVSYAQADFDILGVAAEFLESGAVVLVDIGASERSLSSSEVRESISGSKDGWEDMVPISVAEYIKEHHLYKPTK